MWDANKEVILGSSGNRAAPMGTAIWEYDGADWAVKFLRSEHGGVAGDPPATPGKFKGQLRATPCVEPSLV